MPFSKTSFSQGGRHDALTRLTPFGRTGTIVVTFVFFALFYAMVGYFSHYWRDADMDFMVLYSAFMLNDGRPQAYFDHPGYLTIILTQGWLLALHKIGLLNAYALSAIPQPYDLAGFDDAMNAAVRALRVNIWFVGMAIALAFYALMRRLVSDWRIASLAFTAFVFSGGFAVHLHVARTEMIPAGFTVLALLILAIVAKRPDALRPVYIGIAALLCMLGMENKVQILFILIALPVLAISFGERSPTSPFWRDTSKALPALLALAVLFALLAWQALPLIQTGLDPAAIAHADLKPIMPGRIGFYQAAFAAWIFAGIVVYAMIWRISLTETTATILCIACGTALGLLALKLQYNAGNVVAVFNPIERMLTFVPSGRAAGDGVASLLALIGNGILAAFSQYLFVINPVPRPTMFLLWVIVPGVIAAAWRGEARLFIQTGLLVGTGILMDAVCSQRQIKLEYWVFSDFLFIIAGALLLDGMKDIARSRWAYPVGAVLLAIQIVMGLIEPAKHMLQVQGPRVLCKDQAAYTPELHTPWCTTPPLRDVWDDQPSIFSKTFGKAK